MPIQFLKDTLYFISVLHKDENRCFLRRDICFVCYLNHSTSPLQLSYHEQMEKTRIELGIDAADFGETRTPFTVAITARAQAVDLAL